MKQSRSFRRILFLYILYYIIGAPVGFLLAHFKNFFVEIPMLSAVFEKKFEKNLKKVLTDPVMRCYDVITDGDTVDN